MKKIQAVGVYCSSYEGLAEVYRKAAFELGQQLAEHDITMVYGGGAMGLMGEVSRSTMFHGGRVIGFMPHHLKEFEDPNLEITELHMVDTMHTRKQLMFEHSDAFLALPGGFGTLDETFEIITWEQLHLHDKPIVFVNVNGYWDPLQQLTSNIFDQGFAEIEHKKYFKFVNTVSEAFQSLLKAPEPTVHETVEWL
ncbi:MAG: TIGR00730 family Rossman fold protein [Alphaproteobacteria bacterium]|nr:TIGR00730 family Rossman fold protein [Alphaproteobacteria bacterium]